MYRIKVTEEFGRGLYADKNIYADEVVCRCEILVLDAADTAVVNNTSLRWYTFKFTDTSDCLVLGEGELFNHADSPNVSYRLIDFDGRKVMEFRALMDIPVYHQLFIDYSADTKVSIEEYVDTKSLIR